MQSRRTIRPRAPLLLPLLLLLAAAPLQEERGEFEPLLRPPEPTVALEPPLLERWPELDCAQCHSEVAAEWARSAHGLAWVDAVYQDSLRGKRRPQSCYGCHVPEPLLTDGELPRRVRARDHRAPDAHFGVTCVTCHGGPDDAILGPWGHANEAHASVRSPHFLRGADAPAGGGSDALCASCHATTIGPVIGIAKDFEAADLAARGLSCVGCHMAPVERRWAHAPGADPAQDETVPVRAGRSHALQTPRDPAFLRLAFGWSLGGDPGARRLVLRNQAGHRVPGLVGRVLTFRVTGLDAAGDELGTETLRLDTTAYLPVDGEREVSLDADAVAARVVGLHEDPRVEQAQEFLRLDVTE